MTAHGRRFEPSPYDLGITDEPDWQEIPADVPVPLSLTPAAIAALDAQPEAE